MVLNNNLPIFSVVPPKAFNFVERVPAVYNSKGHRGCFMSHIKCMNLAKEGNYKKGLQDGKIIYYDKNGGFLFDFIFT